MLSYYNLNGRLFLENENNISVNNRSFRYGDGFFETIKLVNNQIQFKELHFERIAQTLDILKFQQPTHFSFEKLEEQIIHLAKKNHHNNLGRLRVTFYRNDGGLYDVINLQPNILIQSFPLQQTVKKLNENGLTIDVYTLARKSCDVFSNIKSNNYLQYTMAAFWAKENKLNDALLLNSQNNIADSTIANIFIIKDEIISTPSLHQGCVDGVMRKHIIHTLKSNNILISETAISVNDVMHADEIFLTNVIKGISWVKACGERAYSNNNTQKIARLIYETYS